MDSDPSDILMLLVMLWMFAVLALVSRALMALKAVRKASAWALGLRDIEPGDLTTRERIRRLHWE